MIQGIILYKILVGFLKESCVKLDKEIFKGLLSKINRNINMGRKNHIYLKKIGKFAF